MRCTALHWYRKLSPLIDKAKYWKINFMISFLIFCWGSRHPCGRFSELFVLTSASLSGIQWKWEILNLFDNDAYCWKVKTLTLYHIISSYSYDDNLWTILTLLGRGFWMLLECGEGGWISPFFDFLKVHN